MMKSIKIGNQTFEIGRVYSNPYHRAFAPIQENPKKTDNTQLEDESKIEKNRKNI